MIQAINTVEDVRQFFRDLVGEGTNFHPDTPFSDYIKENKSPAYTEAETKQRDDLMDQAFKTCEQNNEDIYEIACVVTWPLLFGHEYGQEP